MRLLDQTFNQGQLPTLRCVNSEVGRKAVFCAVHYTDFETRWRNSGGAECANYDLFLQYLCDLLQVPKLDLTTDLLAQDQYVLERAVTFNDGAKKNTGRIDLYKRGCFILETKQGTDLPDSQQKAEKSDRELGLVAEKCRRGHALRGSVKWEQMMQAARFTAVVLTGATAGAVGVRTAAGTSRSAVVFTPTVLASVAARAVRVTLSPNPAATSFRVLALATGSFVRPVDALGRVAREATVSGDGEVSVRGLAPGPYVLRVADSQGWRVVGRVMVE